MYQCIPFASSKITFPNEIYLFEVPNTQQGFTINEGFLLQLVSILQHASVKTGFMTQCCYDSYMCALSLQKQEKRSCSRTISCFIQGCFHVASDIAVKRCTVCSLVCSRQYLVPFGTAQATLGREQALLIVWWARGNSSLGGILRQKTPPVFFTASRAFPSQIRTKMHVLVAVGKQEVQ